MAFTRMASGQWPRSPQEDQRRNPSTQDEPAPVSRTPDDTEAEPVDTLEDLVRRAGDATEEEALAYVEGMTDMELVSLGAQVATTRIDVDTARLYGKALRFFDSATVAQRQAVPGVTPDMLRVAIWTARRGQQKAEQRDQGKAARSSGKAERQTDADVRRAEGLTRREQLHGALEALGKKDTKTKSQIAKAYGSIASPQAHADSLVAMAKLCRTMLADKSPGAVTRRRGSAITEEWLSQTEVLAERVKATGKTATAVQGDAPVTQAEVDRYDGINLRLLELFVEAFDTGHKVDPQIPRLIPISLRRWFSRGLRQPASEAVAPTGAGDGKAPTG